MKYLLTAIYGLEDEIMLVGKTHEEKKTFFYPYRRYLYILGKGRHETIDGRKCYKKYVERGEIYSIRSERTCEDDIPFTLRFMIDRNIKAYFNENLEGCEPDGENIPLKVAYVDVEAYSDGQIRLIGCYCDELYQTDNIYDFVKFIKEKDPDVMVSWFIDFDASMLKKASDYFLHPPFTFFDAYKMYQKIKPHTTYNLKIVCQRELGIEPWGKYSDDMSDSQCREYNALDVMNLKKLDEKLGLLRFATEIKHYVGLPDYNFVFSNMRIIDTIALRKAKEMNKVLPTYRGEKKKYEGAIVLARKGVYRNVAAYDFASFYPTIIMNFKISPEGKDFLPSLVTYLMKEKERWTKIRNSYEKGTLEWEEADRKRQVVKGIINAVYGVCANPSFRLFNPSVAERITALAREGLSQLIDSRCVYAHTDSVFVITDEPEELKEQLENKVNEYYYSKYGVKGFKIEFDEYFKKIVILAKARYFGLTKDNRITYKGVELRRNDTSEAVRKILYELIETILYDRNVIDYISNINLTRFTKEELAIPFNLNKDTYEDEKLMEMIKRGIRRVKYIHTKKGIKYYAEDEEIKDEIDYRKMKEYIMTKIQRILDAVGIDSMGRKQSTLFDF